MKTIRKMYEHVNWANQSILKIFQCQEYENQEVRRLFSHILFAENVWITRLRGLDSSRLPIWSEVTNDECSELVKQNEESFREFLANLKNSDLDKLIIYQNSKGQVFKNSIEEILTHIALHGQYHRGQINLRLREEGFEPVHIDFITFVR